MTSEKNRVVILGAGVAGLSAAYHISQLPNVEVTLIEKMDRVGGLATSFKLGPAIFDFGPHGFHSQESHITQFFEDLMKGDYYRVKKDAGIRFDGQIYPYPLNPMSAVRNMRLSVSIRCGLSYFFNLLFNHKPMDQLENAEEFFVRNFGRELYRIFFEGYTEKVWGIHPSQLSVKFIRNRIPSANILRILWTTLTGRDVKIRKPHEIPLKLQGYYPRMGSIEFPEAMKREFEGRGGRVILEADVQSIEMDGKRATAVAYQKGGKAERLPLETLIATIPLPDVVQKMSPAPSPEILSSSRQLEFRPLVIVCLWVQKSAIFSQQTIYYTNRIFNRLAQMNSYSPYVSPEGTCGITAEITCPLDGDIWKMPEQELVRKVVADMEKEQLLASADVKESMILRSLHGYPVYRAGFEPHLARLRQFIHEMPNLYIAGRQGMFNYAQMHFGVSGGMVLADHLRQGKAKPAIPEGDTEDLLFA